MGAFFANYHVRSDSSSGIATALRPFVQSRAYVSPPKNGWVTVYDEASDDQDDAVLRRIALGLSRTLQTVVIAFLVHDSDIAMYWLYQHGELLDEFNSNPEYFGEKVSDKTRARLRGNTDLLLPFCIPGTARDQVEEVLHPPDGPPLMAEDLIKDLGELLGLDSSRIILGFRYFEEEGAEFLSDVAEFEPVGIGAERKAARAQARVPEMGISVDPFVPLVGMLAAAWVVPQQLSAMLAAAGQQVTDQMIRKQVQSLDRSAREGLKHLQVQGRPTFEELKAARDQGPEALAELLAQRVPLLLTDIGVVAVATQSTLFIAALLKRGLDPTKMSSHGITALAAAERHGKNSTIYQLLKAAADEN